MADETQTPGDDDTEGHSAMKRAADATSLDARQGDQDDVEGHSAMKRAADATSLDARKGGEDDVEGHRYGDDQVRPDGGTDPPGMKR